MINVGVLGATGAVGQRFVQLLAAHPWFSLTTLTASGRSAGRRYGDVVDWRLDAPFPDAVGDLVIAPTDPKSLGDCDIVFSALPAESRERSRRPAPGRGSGSSRTRHPTGWTPTSPSSCLR